MGTGSISTNLLYIILLCKCLKLLNKTVQRHKEGKKHPPGATLLGAKPLLPLPSPNPLRMSPPLLSAQLTSQEKGCFGVVP